MCCYYFLKVYCEWFIYYCLLALFYLLWSIVTPESLLLKFTTNSFAIVIMRFLKLVFRI